MCETDSEGNRETKNGDNVVIQESWKKKKEIR